LDYGSGSVKLDKKAVACAVAISLPSFASASELAYTFLDFEALDTSVTAAGAKTPVPGQTVQIETKDGDGIAVGGSLAVKKRFYMGGFYKSSIVDVVGQVSSPLTTVDLTDTFDLVQSNLYGGYIHAIGDKLDLVFQLSYESSNYDFGSFVGENFDLDESGLGGLFGVRWNPHRAIELFVSGRYSPVAKPLLSEGRHESGSSVSAGLRWYFFENLGMGIEHESGEVDMTTISMRFSFGNLPW
jgi:hypothetical protein